MMYPLSLALARGLWLGLLSAVAVSAASAAELEVRWLGGEAPRNAAGVSWGVPWSKGEIKKDQRFSLVGKDGVALPLQSWPLAYWADGSVKWMGFATVAASDGLLLRTTTQADAITAPVSVRESASAIEVQTGRLQLRIARSGERLVEALSIDGREIARDGRLSLLLQNGPEGETREKFGMKLERAAVEQPGPVRAVIKLEGRHRAVSGASDASARREWLPFVVRLYVYAGSEAVRMTHTIIFDGDQEKDFIRGLGVVWTVPFREQMHNRHVRFAGEGAGTWAEPVLPMVGRGGRFAGDPATGADVYPQQAEGKRVPNREAYRERAQGFLADWASWDAFKLTQPNANGFTIEKRTNAKSAWIAAGAGRRASGFAFVGEVSGGLGISLRNFWQSYPASLEVRGATTDSAELTAWLWSPEGPAMDMRHYSTRAHGLEAAYEDVQEGFSTAHGVARTSELTLFACSETPTREHTAALAHAGAQPAQLVCAPERYHAARAFGVWGLPDRSTPVKRAIEDRLQATLDFYLKQPEQHQWYGFWDFGDVMHSYDSVRHVWRYDLGGMAWANSELGPDMWLWLSFLRTGRADVFRMAEAMTRHTGEVDVYHLGRFAGLGSRHNVRHWGDGAKEARISQAAYRRYHYYITTDERSGDLMREVANVDYKTVEFDPMRLAQPATAAEKALAPTRVRLGPDWLAFVGNWMTEWERTGDTQWRDRILAGVASLDAMPLGMRTGRNLVLGYDPATAKLVKLDDEAGVYNLATIMGGAEVGFELSLMLDDERWQRLWLQYCRLYSAPKDVVLKDRSADGKIGDEGMDARYVRDGRLAGFVSTRLGERGGAFKQAAIDALLRMGRGGRGAPGSGVTGVVKKVEGSATLNPIDEGLGNTNSAAQTGLETIAMLGMVGDALPAEFPPVSEADTKGKRKRGGDNR